MSWRWRKRVLCLVNSSFESRLERTFSQFLLPWLYLVHRHPSLTDILFDTVELFFVWLLQSLCVWFKLTCESHGLWHLWRLLAWWFRSRIDKFCCVFLLRFFVIAIALTLQLLCQISQDSRFSDKRWVVKCIPTFLVIHWIWVVNRVRNVS